MAYTVERNTLLGHYIEQFDFSYMVRILLIITRWGESGKVIFQVNIAVFRALSKNFRAKMTQLP